MAESMTMVAEPRGSSGSQAARKLRRQGRIPAVVFKAVRTSEDRKARARAEDELRRSRDLFASFMNNSPAIAYFISLTSPCDRSSNIQLLKVLENSHFVQHQSIGVGIVLSITVIMNHYIFCARAGISSSTPL